jgi:hypothetical protein
MPANKDLKRLVRVRMEKTGESYTAARAQVVKKSSSTSYAAVAGMSDDAVNAKTGRTWERWVKALDHDGADNLTHAEIAKLIKTKYDTPSWWTQMVAVGYERIKGLRAYGQGRDGTHSASKSRTYPVRVGTLFDAWADARARKRWLGDVSLRTRTATRPKSMRLQGSDGVILEVNFLAKGAGKSAVAIAYDKFPDKAAAERFKTDWAERLDALGESLRS